MKRSAILAALWLFLVAVSFAREDHSLAHARRAQALLGADVWSQVIRVDNHGGTSRYGRTVHALVFELAGILWFYTDADGTQSFSTFRGRLEQDKADFAPLLSEIHRGFGRWTVLPADFTPVESSEARLLNGCFVESVANLRQQVLADGEVTRPQLLSYYAGSGNRISGHTVLTYETSAGVHVIDPVDPSHPMVFSHVVGRNAVALGTALIGRLVERAVWVPVGDFATMVATRYAGIVRGAYDLALN